MNADGVQDATLQQLADSAAAAAEALPGLLAKAEEAGWKVDDVPIRGGPCRLGSE